jgi:hypothetical protein
MTSITNAAGSLGDVIGSFLYERFNNQLYPLILAAAAFTAFNFVLVPLLGLKGTEQSEPVLLAR